MAILSDQVVLEDVLEEDPILILDSVVDVLEEVVLRYVKPVRLAACSAESSGQPPTSSLQALRNAGLGCVRYHCDEKELMRAVGAVQSILEKLQERRDLLEQIFCLVDETDRYMRIDKLVEESKEHVVDKDGCNQLQRLQSLLGAILGILSKPPSGNVYDFPACGQMHLPVRQRLPKYFDISDSQPEGIVSPSALTASLDLVPRGVTTTITTTSATSSDVWVPRGKSVAWAWGDLWALARPNPLRYSKWLDLRQAVEDLQKLHVTSYMRPVYMLMWETELSDNIETSLLWIASHQQGIDQIKWKWADAMAANPARWSPWMSVGNIVTHMESFQRSSRSRQVIMSVSSEKLCPNVPGAANHLKLQISRCQPL